MPKPKCDCVSPFLAPSFVTQCRTCVSTVSREITSLAAIPALLSPISIKASTSRSRSVAQPALRSTAGSRSRSSPPATKRIDRCRPSSMFSVAPWVTKHPDHPASTAQTSRSAFPHAETHPTAPPYRCDSPEASNLQSSDAGPAHECRARTSRLRDSRSRSTLVVSDQLRTRLHYEELAVASSVSADPPSSALPPSPASPSGASASRSASSRLRILPVALRGSSSRKTTSRGTL